MVPDKSTRYKFCTNKAAPGLSSVEQWWDIHLRRPSSTLAKLSYTQALSFCRYSRRESNPRLRSQSLDHCNSSKCTKATSAKHYKLQNCGDRGLLLDYIISLFLNLPSGHCYHGLGETFGNCFEPHFHANERMRSQISAAKAWKFQSPLQTLPSTIVHG